MFTWTSPCTVGNVARSGGPIQVRSTSRDGIGAPSFRNAYSVEVTMPISESISVPSRSNNTSFGDVTSGAPRLQRRHGRQLLAFEEFEERAATGGNIRNILFHFVFFHRRERIAAAG